MNHIKPSKFATLTALAAACTLMLSAPAIAATPDSAAAPTDLTNSASAPSAVDSSKRVIRRAQPRAAASNGQPAGQASFTPTVPVTPKPLAPAQYFQRGPITSTGIDISGGQLGNIPAPQAQITDISFVPTLLIPQTTAQGGDKLDVSLLDDFIKDVSPNVRHYPPNFPNRTQRHNTREKIKVLAEWIEPYANASDASYEVLVRAAKLNGMGRNLDLGSDFAVRASQYIDRAIKAEPDSAEANFLYGMMLAEGGGFKEGEKYLDKAVQLGYTEAEQSLAQSDLLSDRRDQALDRLRRLEQRTPNDPIIRRQIKMIEDGEYYIWDIPAPDVNVKPTPAT